MLDGRASPALAALLAGARSSGAARRLAVERGTAATLLTAEGVRVDTGRGAVLRGATPDLFGALVLRAAEGALPRLVLLEAEVDRWAEAAACAGRRKQATRLLAHAQLMHFLRCQLLEAGGRCEHRGGFRCTGEPPLPFPLLLRDGRPFRALTRYYAEAAGEAWAAGARTLLIVPRDDLRLALAAMGGETGREERGEGAFCVETFARLRCVLRSSDFRRFAAPSPLLVAGAAVDEFDFAGAGRPRGQCFLSRCLAARNDEGH